MTGVEPEHRMHLNCRFVSPNHVRVYVEPEHRMYLNLNIPPLSNILLELNQNIGCI